MSLKSRRMHLERWELDEIEAEHLVVEHAIIAAACAKAETHRPHRDLDGVDAGLLGPSVWADAAIDADVRRMLGDE